MKFIIDVKNLGKKYDFNLYTAFPYEDGAVSEDTRVVFGDDFDIFIAELTQELKKNLLCCRNEV